MIQWPTFLLSTTFHCSLVRDDSVQTIHSGAGLYYGLTWDDKQIFMGCRNNVNRVGGEQVVVLGSDYRVLTTIPGEFRQLHQILFANDNLYVTSPEDNAIDVIGDGGARRRMNWTGEQTDVNHINSVWFDGHSFWVCYHNLCAAESDKSSRVVRLDAELHVVEEEFTIGKSIHNVFVTSEFVYTCNSGEGLFSRLHRYTGQKLEVNLGPWVRGLAVTDEFFLVGTSRKGDRKTREEGDTVVHLLDRKTLQEVDSRRFKDFGAVYSMRVVGQPDYAHNNIPFPGIL